MHSSGSGSDGRVSAGNTRPAAPAGKIRLAELRDIPSVMDIVASAIEAMREEGLDQWDEIYPAVSDFRKDIESGSLRLCEIPRAPGDVLPVDDGTPLHRTAACFALDENPSPEYEPLPWEDRNGRFIVLHRLCVHRAFQGRGIGKTAVRYALDWARENGYTSLRLDAFLENPHSLRLYDSFGMKNVGTVRFRKGLFRCYEFVL